MTLCGRDLERLQMSLTLCVEASGGHPERFITVSGNLTDASTRGDIIQKTVDTFGRLDVMVANAGVALLGQDGSNATEEVFDTLMDVNVKAVFFLIQAAIPHLETAKGNIVVMSSVSAHIAAPVAMVYSMSKAAIDHMVRCLAVDLGPKNIRVNAVNPTWCATRVIRNIADTDDALKVLQDTFSASQAADQPLGNKALTTEAVAEAVGYLASPAAGFVTGQCLLVDAGKSLCGAGSGAKVAEDNAK